MVMRLTLIVQKPTGEEILVEVKSTECTQREHGNKLEKFLTRWDCPCSAQIWSNDPKNRKVGNVHHYHWEKALQNVF